MDIENSEFRNVDAHLAYKILVFQEGRWGDEEITGLIEFVGESDKIAQLIDQLQTEGIHIPEAYRERRFSRGGSSSIATFHDTRLSDLIRVLRMNIPEIRYVELSRPAGLTESTRRTRKPNTYPRIDL